MPFIKTDDGIVTWRNPSNEEIVQNRKDIVEIQETAVQKELTKDLQNKIAEHARYFVSSNKGIIPFINRNIYQTLHNLITSPHELVDIIIPVYNSIHIAKQCIQKVLERTTWPYHIYIVDDASDEYTKKKLSEFAKSHKDKITIITNKKNRGFAATVNRGIKAGKGEYVCLLNSDVLVTDLWLTKMMLATKADPRNQIVCPATNNTAIVNIPLAQGASYKTMNAVFEKFAVRCYPEIMPTGFCFLFHRSLLDKVGYFDEAYISFGEESECWWRTVTYTEKGQYMGYRAVLADDSYVFHERGSSFSSLENKEYMDFRNFSAGRFKELNPGWVQWKNSYNVKKSLGHLRDKIPPAIINDQEAKYRVCWVVHAVDRCGGMQYIADIVNAMIEQGIDAKVALIKRKPDMSTDFIGELRTAPIVFEDYADFLSAFTLRVFKRGVVIAATVELSSVVRAVTENYPSIKGLLHCQSYEPELMADKGLIEKVKQSFLLLPNVITNSHWITEKFKKEHNITPIGTVHPGVDTDLFYSRNRDNGDERLTIMMPVSNLPWRGYDRAIKLLPLIEKEAKNRNLDIRILLVGIKKNPISTSSAIALGPLVPVRVATLLGSEVDLLIDPSFNHSYGLPGLEAMVSGVPLISWDNKGVNEYAGDGSAFIFEDKTSLEDAAATIIDLLENESYRKNLAEKALKVRETHSRAKLIPEFIEVLEKGLNLTFEKRRIVMIVPHLRKHGGPTTLLSIANELSNHGHDVSITTLHSDINHEVTRMTDIPIDFDYQNIPKCDVAIINSDNPLCPTVAAAGHIKKKVLLKLSHNQRFKELEEQGLQQRWDAIITSTGWLKDSCENITPGWNYLPQQAHKVGWWHYSHDTMARPPDERIETPDAPIIIGTLIHHHPLKGSKDAINMLGEIGKKYGKQVQFIGIGEVDPRKFSLNLSNFVYKYSPNREDMAKTLQQMDIWLGASHTEGLGRMALEAMSAGCAVVVSDTQPEFADPGVNCLLYPPKDILKGIELLDRLINDKELRTSIQKEGFKTASTFADPTDCMTNIETVIKGLF